MQVVAIELKQNPWKEEYDFRLQGNMKYKDQSTVKISEYT